MFINLTCFTLLVSSLLFHGRAEASSREFQLFDHAYDSYLSYRPEEAVEGCRLFLKEFPDSSAKDAALYWLGKSLLRTHSLSEANKTFAVLAEQFPESPFIRYIPKEPESTDGAWQQQSCPKYDSTAEAEKKSLLAEIPVTTGAHTYEKATRDGDIKTPREALPGEKAQGILSSSKSRHEKGSVYALQVGAFKTKESAITLRKSLQKKFSSKNVAICRQGDYYKVRITGFEDIEEVNAIMSAGFNALVVRTGEASCGEVSQSLVSLPK
jgi:hypothetical protein